MSGLNEVFPSLLVAISHLNSRTINTQRDFNSYEQLNNHLYYFCLTIIETDRTCQALNTTGLYTGGMFESVIFTHKPPLLWQTKILELSRLDRACGYSIIVVHCLIFWYSINLHWLKIESFEKTRATHLILARITLYYTFLSTYSSHFLFCFVHILYFITP